MPFLEFYHEAGPWAAATVFEAVPQTLEETLPCLLGFALALGFGLGRSSIATAAAPSRGGGGWSDDELAVTSSGFGFRMRSTSCLPPCPLVAMGWMPR